MKKILIISVFLNSAGNLNNVFTQKPQAIDTLAHVQNIITNKVQ